MDNSLAGGYQPRRTTGGNSDGGDVPVLPWPSLVEPSESLPGRIEVPVAIAGLRHLEASAEPALVFSHLAAVCVPAVCDDVVIDLVENGHGYRIPSTSALHVASTPRGTAGHAIPVPVGGSRVGSGHGHRIH